MNRIICNKIITSLITLLVLFLLAGGAGAAHFEEWKRTFTGAGNAAANSVRQTADGGYIFAGATYNQSQYGTWLVKTDAWGNEQWNKSFWGGGNGSIATPLEETKKTTEIELKVWYDMMSKLVTKFEKI